MKKEVKTDKNQNIADEMRKAVIRYLLSSMTDMDKTINRLAKLSDQSLGSSRKQID